MYNKQLIHVYVQLLSKYLSTRYCNINQINPLDIDNAYAGIRR